MLKIDLHIHSNKDPEDSHFIEYSPEEMVVYASKQGYDAISFTHHNKLFMPSQDLLKIAEQHNIILILGVEATIEGKEVLIYNIGEDTLKNINTLEDLKHLPDTALVIAPHPFYKDKKCLGNLISIKPNLFDAIEYCHFYTFLINWNRKAVKLAKKLNKPLVGTSDSHHLFQFGTTYTLVNADKNIDSIIKAIKENKIQLVTKPLPLHIFAKLFFSSLVRYIAKRIKLIVK